MIRAAFLLLFVLGLQAARADPATDPIQVQPTWDRAVVYAPAGTGRSRRLSTAELPGYLADRQPLPVIVYSHGCSGIERIGHAAGEFYARNGYLFVAPDSFARPEKPTSCQPALRRGGLHRNVLGWRHAEIDFAIAQLRNLPGLSDAKIALVGHSEGGIATATYRGAALAARVIEGWTCQAGWSEYRGLNAPRDEPVLSLVGEDDPWFRLPELRGDCGAFMDGNDRSVVFRKPGGLARRHWLMRDPAVREIVITFLRAQL